MSSISKKIEQSSAIPAWSGFVYQGKVALYHCVSLLINAVSRSNYLKVETLEDFVIYNANHKVLSLHQVKTMKSEKRYDYAGALKQAAEICTDKCDEKTERWFHVSADLNDVSSRPKNLPDEYEVKFYKYRNGKHFIETADIDTQLSQQVKEYLSATNLLHTDVLIEHKLGLLQTLLAAKVNLAHHRNQKGGLSKFKAADSVSISLKDIEDCLKSEVISEHDEHAILLKFQSNLIERTDQLLAYHEGLSEPNETLFSDVCICRHAIANMDVIVLKRLYHSQDPALKEVKLSGSGKQSIENYMNIIAELQQLICKQDLPYYWNKKFGKYLPTALSLTRFTKGLSLDEIQTNVDGLRGNLNVQDVLYDYDNLIVNMSESAFKLNGQESLTGRFIDVGSQEKNRLVKINNVRFVSSDDAKGELID